jgi:hypothetical protein
MSLTGALAQTEKEFKMLKLPLLFDCDRVIMRGIFSFSFSKNSFPDLL